MFLFMRFFLGVTLLSFFRYVFGPVYLFLYFLLMITRWWTSTWLSSQSTPCRLASFSWHPASATVLFCLVLASKMSLLRTLVTVLYSRLLSIYHCQTLFSSAYYHVR